MRAVLFGLVGFSLLAGSPAQAECFLLSRAHGDADPKVVRPDLAGQAVRLVRGAKGGRWDAVEVATGAERFVVRVDFTPHALPASMGFSWAGSQGAGIDWRKGRKPDLSDGIEIYDGPLAGLALDPAPCP